MQRLVDDAPSLRVALLSASRASPWLGFGGPGGPRDSNASCNGTARHRERLCKQWSKPFDASLRDGIGGKVEGVAVQGGRQAGGNPNPRLQRGRKLEPRAINAFADFSGIPDSQIFANPKMCTHPEFGLVGAIPDALIGENAVLEVKAPWKGCIDGDAEITLSNATLLQVHIQLEVTGREFAFVVHYCDEYMWIWKVLRDHPSFHSRGVKRKLDDFAPPPSRTLWQVCLPEYQKYADMVKRGGVSARQHDGISMDTKKNIRTALSEYRRNAVFKMVCPKHANTGAIEWKLCHSEPATNPTDFTLIDRVLTPEYLIRGPPFLPAAQRLLRVHWTDMQTGDFYDPCGDDNRNENKTLPPRGGFIRSEFYSHSLDISHLPDGMRAWGIRPAPNAD